MTSTIETRALREQMQQSVEGWIRAYAEQEQGTQAKYWHPLSLPTYDEAEIAEALDSMCRFRTSMGEKTRLFEKKFAAAIGSVDAVMVNSGSTADLLSAFLLTDPNKPLLKPGDEVLLPAVTWPTQVWSILMAGLEGRLVDVDPRTLNMDMQDLKRKITPKTKAIFLVHLMGCPMDMTAIRQIADEHDLLILEDSCESLGAQWQGQSVGTFGLAGTYSFFFSHHMTTMEGGMIACQSEAVGAQLRTLRAHGWARETGSCERLAAEHQCDPRYLFVNWGFNVRPTEVQASFGLLQLERLTSFHQRRNALAERFYSAIEHHPWLRRPQVLDGAEPAWFSLPVLVDRAAPFARNELVANLEAAGIETRAIVTGNLGRQPAAKMFSQLHIGHLPGADEIHDQGIYLGLSPMYDLRQMDRLAHAIEDSISRCVAGSGQIRKAA